jgi:rare lipoprotein A
MLRHVSTLAVLALLNLGLVACMAPQPVAVIPPSPASAPVVPPPAPIFEQVGEASWYGEELHGRVTASGHAFNKDGLTAAHRTLPLATKAIVTNLSNGRSVEVVVNDRGPFVKGRIIDLSAKAAKAIGIKDSGVAKVRVRVMPQTGDPIVEAADIER